MVRIEFISLSIVNGCGYSTKIYDGEMYKFDR